MTQSAKYLTGFANAKLKKSESLNKICGNIIPLYNIDRFEAIAFRVYLGKENKITVFAFDKLRKSINSNKKYYPVKKFKLDISILEFIPQFYNINFTISTGKYDLDKIRVINK